MQRGFVHQANMLEDRGIFAAWLGLHQRVSICLIALGHGSALCAYRYPDIARAGGFADCLGDHVHQSSDIFGNVAFWRMKDRWLTNRAELRITGSLRIPVEY